MKIIIYLLFFLIQNSIYSQIVNISDINFKNKLLNYSPIIDLNNDDEIQESEALLVTQLIINNSNINSLEGIQYFKNLYYLDCNFNEILEIKTSNLTNLSYLSCNNNLLTSIDLTKNIDLNDIRCSYNKLNEILIPNFKYPINADFSYNILKSIDLTKLTSFVTLNLSNNDLTNISFNSSQFTYVVDGTFSVSNNPLVKLDMSQLRNDNFGDLEGIDISNTLLPEIILPPLSVKYIYINDNPNLLILNMRNGRGYTWILKEEYFDIGISIENNPLLKNVCVDDFEYDFFRDILIIPNALISTDCSLSTQNNVLFGYKSIYPNPTINILNIDINEVITLNSISINNTLGQLIKSSIPFQKFDNKITIDVSNLKSGTYFLSLFTEKGKSIQKFVKL